MVFYLIGFFIFLIGITDFKKGFLCLLVFKIVLVRNINLVSLPGLPLVSLDLFLCFIFLIHFVVSYNKYKILIKSFPFRLPFIIIGITTFISSLTAVAGFASAFAGYMGTLILDFLFIWIIWVLVEEDKDFKWILKWITLVFFISCIYCYFEKLTHMNPIVEYENSLMGNDERAIKFYTGEESANRGYRVQSFFEHTIGAGLNWALYVVSIFTLLLKVKYKFPLSQLAVATALMSLLCIVFSNGRSSIVFLVVGALGFLNFRNSRTYLLICVLALLLLIVIQYVPEYALTISSIFNSDAQSEVSGSSLEQRLGQFEAAGALLNNNVLFGLGQKFVLVLNNANVDDLLGMESIWLNIITSYGLIGLLAYLILLFYSIVLIPKTYHSKPAFFLSAAYWTASSVTSTPGFLLYLYYTILILFIKMTPVYQQRKHFIKRENEK